MQSKIVMSLALAFLSINALHSQSFVKTNPITRQAIANTSLAVTVTPSPQPTVTHTPTITASPLPTAVPTQAQAGNSSNNNLSAALITGTFGVTGTILGVIISFWLTLRRDQLLREEEARSKIREKLTKGAEKIAEAHSRSKLPFSGGDALLYPTSKKEFNNKKEALMQNIQELFAEAEQVKAENGVLEILEFSVQQVKEYILNKEKPK